MTDEQRQEFLTTHRPLAGVSGTRSGGRMLVLNTAMVELMLSRTSEFRAATFKYLWDKFG